MRLRCRDRPGYLVCWCRSGVPPCTPGVGGPPQSLRGANGQRGLLYVPEGKSTPAGGPWLRPGELWRAVCLGGSGTSWDRGRRCPKACPW